LRIENHRACGRLGKGICMQVFGVETCKKYPLGGPGYRWKALLNAS
jgi:hypothetical protein